MNHKRDLDKLMYLLGQENAIEELKNSTESHDFSEEYKNKKKEILKNLNYMQNRSQEDSMQIYNKKGKKIMKKKLIVLIAAITATLALSITAYDVNRRISVTENREAEKGIVTRNIESEVNSTQIPKVNIIPEYLPEGYLEINGAPGKYAHNGDPGSADQIFMYQNDYIYQNKAYNVSSIEDTVIGDIKAKIITTEGSEYKYSIELIYEEDAQIITIGGTASLETLKKVAENIKYEVIPGEFLELYKPDYEEVDENEVYIAPPIPADYVFDIGKEIKDKNSADQGLMFTVKNVNIVDKLPEVDQNCFWDYNEYRGLINDDGTIKDYDRSVSVKWENNQLNCVTIPAKRKFAYITLIMRNPSDTEVKDISVHPMVQYRKRAADGTLEAFPDDTRGGNYLAGNIEPMYFDQSDYEGRHFFFCDFSPNEVKEIHLIYPIDAENADNAYINFNQSGNGSVIGGYVKLTK